MIKYRVHLIKWISLKSQKRSSKGKRKRRPDIYYEYTCGIFILKLHNNHFYIIWDFPEELLRVSPIGLLADPDQLQHICCYFLIIPALNCSTHFFKLSMVSGCTIGSLLAQNKILNTSSGAYVLLLRWMCIYHSLQVYE